VEVVDCYQAQRAAGGRSFLLQQSGQLVGDGDLRNIEGSTAELAIMIGGRTAQGRGLGTRFAVMLQAFAFQVLALERLYVSIIPANTASRRLFDKLGYQPDDSPEARTFIDDETDLTLSLERSRFERERRAELAELTSYERAAGAQSRRSPR
jgi:RimJ/RimL family protein N-acetyltransferase